MSINITQSDIEQALLNEAFTLYYQPKVNFLTGKVSGAEALIRWQDPEGGFISPSQFIPIAEEMGLITKITEQILPIAINMIQSLKEKGYDIPIAVNMSPIDFYSDKILELMKGALSAGRITPKDLKVELTETAALESQEIITSRLHMLADMGFELVMDDFGTGYSSIDLLSQLPFSGLKVDQGVVSRMAGSSKNLNIINMIINMARTLRMHVVAEGIEDYQSYRFLAYAGCIEAQGYWISKPLSFDEFYDFIDRKPQYPCSHIGMIYHAHLNNVYFRKCVLDAVMYKKCNTVNVMSSVVLPDIHFDPKKTRFGQWYFGLGQELAHYPNFIAMEEPHQKMHALGKRLCTTDQYDNVPEMIKEFNAVFEQVNFYLHALEGELVDYDTCQEWACNTGDVS